MDELIAYYWNLPTITRSWLTLTLGLTAAVSMDWIDREMLVWDWDRFYNHLELWRLLTSFCYAHGNLQKFHVLILLYLILNMGRSYELHPFNLGAGGTTADAAFAILFCSITIVTTVPLLNQYGPTILLKLGPLLLGHNNNKKRYYYSRRFFNLEPIYTRTLVYSLLYLWSRRNPNARANINMIPVQGKFLWCAHLGLGWVLNHRVNEMIHGIFVGHLFFYLTIVVPTVTQGRFVPLRTPQFLIDLFNNTDTQRFDQDGLEE